MRLTYKYLFKYSTPKEKAGRKARRGKREFRPGSGPTATSAKLVFKAPQVHPVARIIPAATEPTPSQGYPEFPEYRECLKCPKSSLTPTARSVAGSA
jgi:hypothetical protein